MVSENYPQSRTVEDTLESGLTVRATYVLDGDQLRLTELTFTGENIKATDLHAYSFKTSRATAQLGFNLAAATAPYQRAIDAAQRATAPYQRAVDAYQRALAPFERAVAPFERAVQSASLDPPVGTHGQVRPDGTDEWWEEFAAFYQLRKAQLGARGSVVKAIAEQASDHNGEPVPWQTVQRWSTEARRRGLLPPTTKTRKDRR